MILHLIDHTEDGLPIPVSCQFTLEPFEGGPSDPAGGWDVVWIKYGNTQYFTLEDLKTDYPDCATELEGLLDKEYEEYQEERDDNEFYGVFNEE